jgi:Sjogren's syndrome/scleroderma autoantigen 1 (Autoantigen p27)
MGTYMLKGWVMTDTVCQNAGCEVCFRCMIDGYILMDNKNDSSPHSDPKTDPLINSVVFAMTQMSLCCLWIAAR